MTDGVQVDPIKAEFNISELEYLTSAKGNQWPGSAGRRPGARVILEDDSTIRTPGRRRHQSAGRPRTGTIAVVGSFPNPGISCGGPVGKIRAASMSGRSAPRTGAGLNEIPGVVPGRRGPTATARSTFATCNVDNSRHELIVERGLQAGEGDRRGFARVDRACGSTRNPPRSDPRIPRPGVASEGR